MQLMLRFFARLYSVLKTQITAEIAAGSLEADACPPTLLLFQPVYARNPAGVVAPYALGTQHLDTRSVYVRQTQCSPRTSRAILAAAAFCMPAAQMMRFDYSLPPAITAAEPRCLVSNVFRRA